MRFVRSKTRQCSTQVFRVSRRTAQKFNPILSDTTLILGELLACTLNPIGARHNLGIIVDTHSDLTSLPQPS